jgi:hypothetical protein
MHDAVHIRPPAVDFCVNRHLMVQRQSTVDLTAVQVHNDQGFSGDLPQSEASRFDTHQVRPWLASADMPEVKMVLALVVENPAGGRDQLTQLETRAS